MRATLKLSTTPASGRASAVPLRHAWHVYSRARQFSLHACTRSLLKEEVTVYAPTQRALEHIASTFASSLKAGDCYCLYGDVGAGKSVFSRAFIRTAAQDPYLHVPSPTYLLENVYDDHGVPAIHHFDLYRLSTEKDLQRLNLQQSMSQGVCLFEWAERLQRQVPAEHLAVHISILDEPPAVVTQAQSQASAAATEKLQRAALHDAVSNNVVNGADEDWQGQDEDEDVYTDKRCRQVTMIPHGEYWQHRLLPVLDGLLHSSAQRAGVHVVVKGSDGSLPLQP